MSNQFVDSEVQIDLTNVDEFGGGGGPTLEPGEYVFDIVAAAQATSKTNNPVWKVEFVVAEGPDTGKKLVNSYSLQPQALGRVKMLALAIGASLTTIKASEYVGSRLRASVTHTTGDAQPGPNGQPLPPRVFQNIANERPYETAEEIAAAAPPPPPVTQGRGGRANGATRRA